MANLEDHFDFVGKVQNKMKINSLYGALALPPTNDPTEIEKLKSALKTEMEIYATFYKPVKHQKN